MTITINRINETIIAKFEGTSKLRSKFNQRIYINNTLNHRIYLKKPDGDNKRIAEASIKEMHLRLNENQTRVTHVTKVIFKDEEQNTITVPAKKIYKTDLNGLLYHDVDHYRDYEEGLQVINKYFNEFMNQIMMRVIEKANMELRDELQNHHRPPKPYPKHNKYDLKKTSDKTIITLPIKTNYHNTHQNHDYYNNKENNTLKYRLKDDELITLSHMSLDKVIINKAYEELNTTQYSDVLFQFSAANGKKHNFVLPDTVTDSYDTIYGQLDLFYFYLDIPEGKSEYSNSVYCLVDFLNIVLVELMNKVLEFDTNELKVEISPIHGELDETINIEAEIIDPYGDNHDGTITFYLED
ncbi:hypothetical protein [Methanosphaera sp.]|uniref:hypothetical protein n=1 Tax=Methanosphaera sp. TaxID=2666342 RepID=UPI0025DFBAFF|nr:hypothetical protein [Methanosphaera sp.]